MRYQIFARRLQEDTDENAMLDPTSLEPIYEGTFDSNEDMADDIGEQAGNAISEAIRCDVALMNGRR